MATGITMDVLQFLHFKYNGGPAIDETDSIPFSCCILFLAQVYNISKNNNKYYYIINIYII